MIKKQQKEALRTAKISLIGNLIMAISKGIAGFFGNSYALIADAIESMTDVFASILVVFGLKYSTKPPDKNHPYGHGKAEPLLTFVVVAILIISALVIARESIENIATPHKTPKPYTLIVLAAVVIFKELFYRWVNKKSQENKSTALKADAWHHRSDAITSLLAFIGISISIFLGPGYESADDWAALFATGFILYNAYLIFRPALAEIMDEHIHDDLYNQIMKISEETRGVELIEKCMIRKVGMVYHIDLHLEVKENITVKEGHDIAHRLKANLMNSIPEIAEVMTHVEPHSHEVAD